MAKASSRAPLLPLLPVLLLAWAWEADAALRVASYYGDHMVLQKEPSRAVIWGYKDADANATVTVTISNNQSTLKKHTAEVEEKSKIWRVLLSPMAQGGPYNIEIQQAYKKGISNVTLKDVYFGDVWLCSGQSNMEMTVSQIFNATEELKNASDFPLVRVFAAAHVESVEELQDLAGIQLNWSIPKAEILGHGDFSYFSAVCWLFGRYLFEKLNYPIGLIESSWGGTPIETWSSKKALQDCGLSKRSENARSSELISGPKESSILWNAMIRPLVNMTIHGVIWYQGEANTVMNMDLYNCTFPALIDDWRKTFHEGSQRQTQRYFPFGFVQLCTEHQLHPDDTFSVIRWHQTADFGFVPNKKMPNTFMAVTIDLGDENSPYGSIHPRDKQSVAYRLYLGALALAYAEKSTVFQGPYPQNIQVDVLHKNITVTYEESILLRNLDNKTFEVCCFSMETCKWNPVTMSSASSHTVILRNVICPNTTVGLRYAWNEWPCQYRLCPLYNTQELPAPPFVLFSLNNPEWTVV
uniref:Sialic acid acetylesterase n=1 Tax=Salvator merianae TaxID=96440 RepID=A0A8D0BS21_SALMN